VHHLRELPAVLLYVPMLPEPRMISSAFGAQRLKALTGPADQ
jgi:hypothetical protein